MPLARVIVQTIVAVSGFALLMPSVAEGQDQLPEKDRNAGPIVAKHRNTIRGGIRKEELEEARKAFKAFAKYYADVVAHPTVWKASLDPKPDPFNRIPTIDDGPNGILRDIDRFLIEPSFNNKENLEPADYIREMGAALDAALRNHIETHQERIVRINAARVLAHVAKTGAPAHFRTVIELLSNPNTATEIKHYMLQAAANLLAASDPTDLKMRKHAVDPKIVGELVKVLQDCVDKPAMLIPGFKPETATGEQYPVIALVRRQAIRALGQVKYVTVPGPDGTTPLYPAYTLVRVAMSDPALVPTPGPADTAEAVIGLCNMAPMKWERDRLVDVRGYNVEVAIEAILQGLVTFAGPRAANPSDKSLPWQSYALRIGEAMYNWRPLFDPFYDITQPARYDANSVPPAVGELYKFVVPKILAPMAKADGVIAIEDLRRLLAVAREKKNRKLELFDGVKGTSIAFPPPPPPPPPPMKK